MKVISELLLDALKQKQMGESAKTTFDKNRGSIDQALELITPFIQS